MRAILGILVVLGLAAGGGWLYWEKVVVPGQQRKAAAGAPAGFAMPVEVAAVTIAPAERRINAVGTLRSNESVLVRPEVGGRISAFGFEEGQKVKKGQMLLQLDASIERAELAQAQAQLVLARANAERADELMRRGAGTQRALDEARAALRTGEAAVQLYQARIEKLTVHAPFDGIAGLRRVSIGAFVQTGADIVNVEQIDPIKVDFRVPELFLAAVKPGQRMDLGVGAFPDETFQGELMAIDPLIDAAGRSIVIRARMDNPGDRLRPGMFARVTLALATRSDGIWVPEQSLVPQGNKQFVFKVAEAEGKTIAQMVEVKLGLRRNGNAEIVEGLAKGDRVVTGGLLKIRDGAPIQVLPAAPPKATGEAPAAAAARG
ncbi:MAG: efflux RND transporter periplasmic adaptor subunit [Alphaproteobacteria bacterium]